MTSLPNCVNLEGSAEGGRVRGTVWMGMKLYVYEDTNLVLYYLRVAWIL